MANIIKKGRHGRPKMPADLPGDVWNAVDGMMYSDDIDWTQLVVDGQAWVVLKTWEDESEFSVVAAKIEYETQPINVDSIRHKQLENKMSYYNLFERTSD